MSPSLDDILPCDDCGGDFRYCPCPQSEGDDDCPEWLEDMKVLDLQPGDILVLRSDEILSQRYKEHLYDQLSAVFERLGHDEVEAVVLEDGMDIGVLRNEGDS